MSYYIIIRGPLAVGKSVVARELAKKLDGKYISMDGLLEKHGLDKVSKDEECIPAKNFIKANDIILPEVRDYLKEGKVVVFDGCFYHKEQIEYLEKNLDYEHYIFTLKASVDTCIERDKGRERVYGKDAAKVVHSLVSRFDYGTVIDTEGKTLDETVKEILSYL